MIDHPKLEPLIDFLRDVFERLTREKLQTRAAALSFHSLLAIVPAGAVTFALIDWVGGGESTAKATIFLVKRYLPPQALEAADTLIPLMQEADFGTIGLLGSLMLLPVVISLVRQVELAFADIFDSPRGKHLPRIFAYGILVTLVPMLTLMTITYAPSFNLPLLPFLIPLIGATVVFFMGFRFLPRRRPSKRSAWAGAAISAVLLTTCKIFFGILGARVGFALHAVWGAITFVPMVLIWVLITWTCVLFGAVFAATVDGRVRRNR